MADTKLSGLVELAATPASDDEVYIRDVSELSADESKRITIANLMAAGATITIGDVEVYNAAAPNTWTDLDLSGTIGANTALLLIKVVTAAAGSKAVYFRKNGDTDEFYVASDEAHSHGVAGVGGIQNVHAALVVAADSSGIIEWKCEDTSTLVIDIIAYIK